MARLSFKPMPGLSIVLAISVAILISLGVWQYNRLSWKTALLSEIEASVTAPPFKSLSELARAIEDGNPVDFRRIEFDAIPVAGAPSFHLYSSQSGGIYWDVVEPLKSQSYTILAKTGELNNKAKADAPNKVTQTAQNRFVGYARKTYPMGMIESWVKSKANPDTNRYFYFNQTGDWYEGLRIPRIEGYYIDVVNAENADALPVMRPDIANNHFDYMLTWWSFALIFIIIYLILHKRAGRLSFKS
jgi:surfeit locus 1 family protein